MRKRWKVAKKGGQIEDKTQKSFEITQREETASSPPYLLFYFLPLVFLSLHKCSTCHFPSFKSFFNVGFRLRWNLKRVLQGLVFPNPLFPILYCYSVDFSPILFLKPDSSSSSNQLLCGLFCAMTFWPAVNSAIPFWVALLWHADWQAVDSRGLFLEKAWSVTFGVPGSLQV